MEELEQHTKNILHGIHTQYPNPAELIKVWLQQDYHECSLGKDLKTWSHVVLALKSLEVGESQLEEHLNQKYLPGELFSTFTTAALVP